MKRLKVCVLRNEEGLQEDCYVPMNDLFYKNPRQGWTS